MNVEKQREIIRLWNRMRQVEGPVAEEIRIQILECFAQPDSPSARMNERRAVLKRVPVRTAQIYRIGEVDSAAVKVDGIDAGCMLHACCRVCAIIFKVRSSPA